MNELHLFAGVGGGILGGKLLGHSCVCAVENNSYCKKILLQRQRDGVLEKFPIWDDIKTFNGMPWCEKADVVCGGFPCQDISVAGKGHGLRGEKSGLWFQMARVIGEVLPKFIFVENSPMLIGRGMDAVLGSLSSMGYNARWGIFGADQAAFKSHHRGIAITHQRDRIFILAKRSDIDCVRELQSKGSVENIIGRSCDETENAANANMPGCKKQWEQVEDGEEYPTAKCCDWWAAEPGMVRMAHGVPNRLDRIKGLGNAQVPAVVALAWRELGGPLK